MKRQKILRLISLVLALSSSSCGLYSRGLFVTSRVDNNYRWTLTSRLGQALEMAENKYGQRDLSWTVLGIEINDQLSPQIWYLGGHRGQKQIIIQLGRLSTLSEKTALGELSHEVIHILSPQSGKNTVSVLEEGLANYFSMQYLMAIDMAVSSKEYINDNRYLMAYEHVLKLYTAFEDADKRIKQLRAQAGSFSAITEGQLKQAFPGFTDMFYSYLASNFGPGS